MDIMKDRKRTPDSKTASRLLLESGTYREFKMKMRLAGMDMYNIPVLRAVHTAARQKGACLLRDFMDDLKANIDSPALTNHALDSIRAHMDGETVDRFSTDVANTWIEKHEHEYR